MTTLLKKFGWWSAILGLALSTVVQTTPTAAQDQGQNQDQYQDQQGDQQDDPPGRVARLGYMEGSVSFQPAGEEDWVQAVANRPMTTGDKLWADKDSRAELQLGSAVIRLSSETGFSFLNLDDNTVQIQLTAGALNVRVRELDQNDSFEIDTPNLAFSIEQPGSYRVQASEDGNYTVVSVKDGGGEATGNGQTYTLHNGQKGTFSGTDSLNADVVELDRPDAFDNWAYSRDHRYDQSRSAQYVSHDVVGYEDLDDYGDWRDDSSYGHVWYPRQVEADWAPYHTGHWVWISPWGYTWVDDSPWGYAPFHYGRWVTIGGRWGWIAGPIAVRPVYAPALVVFIGGGVGVGFGGNVGWFPLGPREVYVPSYRVSRGYVNRVNISNTTVTNVQITNVYNTTIINKTTNVTNVTYVNRNVRGSVMAVPQRTFVSSQPVRGAAVRLNENEIRNASLTTRVAVAPTRESVLGVRASTAGRVTAPPQAVVNRQVIAKRTPPPPPVSFARQQQALQAHPGQALTRRDVQTLRPAAAAEAPHPMVKVAPAGRPATPNQVGPGNRPGNQQGGNRPGQPGATPSNNQPGNRPGNQPGQNDRPGMANPNQQSRPGQENRPADNRPADNRPNGNQPGNRPNNPPDTNRPNQPTTNDQQQPNRPTPNDRPNRPNNPPDTNRPTQPSTNDQQRPDRPTPNDRPNRPNNPPDTSRPNQPSTNEQQQPNRPTPNDRPNHPNNPPDTNRPSQQQDRQRTDQPMTAPRNDRPTEAQPAERPERNRPNPNADQPAPRNERPSNTDRPAQRTPPPDARPAPQHEEPKAQRPPEKKQEEKKPEERKHDEKPPSK